MPLIPHTCPKCGGEGNAGFVLCHPCTGTGIVWGFPDTVISFDTSETEFVEPLLSPRGRARKGSL